MQASTRQPVRPTSLLVWTMAALVSATGGLAADPGPTKSGGLVPGSATPRTGLTREELIREWDLDGDGTISKPESDVARGRMRRRRLEMQLSAGIDPITGLPRSIDPTDPDAESGEGDELIFRLPPEPPPAPKRPEQSLPGMRPPAMNVPDGGAGATLPAAPTPTTASPSLGNATGSLPPPRSGRASWLPTQRLSPAMTGGVRAGAPAAVPGYGAGPWSDLNAGRRPPPPIPATGQLSRGSAATPAPGSGGLLPAGRTPGRTGALIIPQVPGQSRGLPAAARPVTPPPLTPQPRITAEEIGGYRP